MSRPGAIKYTLNHTIFKKTFLFFLKIKKTLNGDEFMIYGNIEGIRNVILERLEALYDLKLPKDEILNSELTEVLCDVTKLVGREISVAIDRRGNIINISIGDSSTVEMPLINVQEKKLSGVKIIHTHPNGNSRLSSVDVSALLKMKLDCIVAIGVLEGTIIDFSIGFCIVKDEVLSAEIFYSLNSEDVQKIDFMSKIKLVESYLQKNIIVEDDIERAVIVGIEDEESLNELQELARACNVLVVDKVVQKKVKIDKAFYIGSGKVGELGLICQTLRVNTIIFDDELTATQVRNIEDALGIKVIDRTTLILEIFASRARSKESKIQVELAQLKYRLPRLSGLGAVLSRTGGGIGTKGPGEKKLEIDKRRIRERIFDLNQELEKVRTVRETQRYKRNDNPKVALVGYTNAGKSTLRNKLCDMAMPSDISVKEKVFEADMLFATLDVTTRAIILPDNRLITLTDTVGFIKKLPHDLVEAFKSTLEEVTVADLLIHVVDSSSLEAQEQIEAVEEVLKELKADDKPTIILLNKIDMANQDIVNSIKSKYEKVVCISAKYGDNIDSLLECIIDVLPQKLIKAQYLIPYDDQKFVAYLHRNSNIEKEEYRDDGTYISTSVEGEIYNKCLKYMINIK